MTPISFPTTAMITQAMLAHHKRLREQITELQRQCDPSRQLLLELHAMGADVEPGPLILHVESRERRAITEAHLVPIIGQAHYEHLKSQVAPTVTHYVKVVEA